MSKKTIWFIPAFLVAVGIFLLSTFLALPIHVEGVGYFDKIEHSFAYLVLIMSFMIAFKKAEMLSAKLVWILLLSTAGYGFGLELVQYTFFANRYFGWMDVFANVLGVLLGFIVFKLFNRG
ncbi:VanZ family protein [Ekhidna sp. To15]|uniref:VanZ family protein n=1 Tax=Ekhidna sp. To15 TaxID=3395267 RepID=UPI003F526D61